MRILLVAALFASIVFESHQLAAQNPSTPSAENANPAGEQKTDAGDKAGSSFLPQGIANVADEAAKFGSRFNIPIKTTGGTQVWTDHAYRDGYRVQEHALTGHCRLLDGGNVRRAWGTKEQCLAALENYKPKPADPAKPQQVAVLLHGLMRTSHSMKPLEVSLKEEGFDDIIRFSYASSRRSIGDHAAALRVILEDQPTNTQFTFAGHSMGNIVVRHLVGDLQRDGDPAGILPRCRCMVMLGPPNQGASISRRLAPTGLYGLLTGKGGMELGPEWAEFVKRLATPPFPFAIVAGDVSDNTIQNPLVDGDGDFVVGLDEAKLDGCAEFHTVPVLHSFLMNDPKAIELSVEFIRKHP
ncbi:MAG: lipase [Pirellulaceae bacterium]|nr:lipase [Pirellulaceae bacterium]